MKYGISFLPDDTPTERNPASYFQQVLEVTIAAEAAGLHTVKMTEHYLNAYGGYCPNPLMFLAAVAARTKNIRLMTGCILPIFHHPVQTAAEIAMVDALSNGRVDIGFGRAHVPREFEVFEVPFQSSRDRFEQSVLTIIDLLGEMPVSRDTPYFSFNDVKTVLEPTQRPHPPIWGAAIATPGSFTWFGKNKLNLLVGFLNGPSEFLTSNIKIYREAFRAACTDNTPASKVAVSLPLYIAEDDRVALAYAQPRLTHYLEVWANAAKPWKTLVAADYEAYSSVYQALKSTTPDIMCKNGGAVVGSPSRVIDMIGRMKEQIDVDKILWQLDFGSMSHSEMRRTLDLFAEKVIPFV